MASGTSGSPYVCNGEEHQPAVVRSQFDHILFRRLVGWAAVSVFGVLLASAQGDDLALQSHHAKELMASGRFEEAIPIYERLVRALPGNEGLVLNLGLAEYM